MNCDVSVAKLTISLSEEEALDVALRWPTEQSFEYRASRHFPRYP